MIRNQARRYATVLGVLSVLLACSGCISVSSPDPSASAGPPPSYLERIKTAKLVEPTSTAAKTLSDSVRGFVVGGKDIACVLTGSRNGQINSPLEPNNFTDPVNQPQPLVPVVQCELATYPVPTPQDVKDNCGGTGVGYLGGVALLKPDQVSYGSCRTGLTGMEAGGDDSSNIKKVLAQFPVLDEGKALDSQGYRCVPMDSGVACANLSNGVGFFIAKDKYELFGAKQ